MSCKECQFEEEHSHICSKYKPKDLDTLVRDLCSVSVNPAPKSLIREMLLAYRADCLEKRPKKKRSNPECTRCGLLKTTWKVAPVCTVYGTTYKKHLFGKV